MKMILAFVPPHRLDRVTRALKHVEGFRGMTVTEGQGFGRERLEEEHDSRDQLTDTTPTARLEVVVPASLAEEVVTAIVEASHTGAAGDGKIFVLPVEQAVRIRTREYGPDAIGGAA